MPKYKTVEEQIPGLNVSWGQIGNVIALVEYEQQSLLNPERSGCSTVDEVKRMLQNYYPVERVPNLCVLIKDGKVVVENDYGSLKRKKESAGPGTYLAHIMGAEVNFSLADRLDEPALSIYAKR